MSPVITIITHQPHKPITKTKKKMDTETVLEIIKMLDNQIDYVNVEEYEGYDQYDPTNIKNEGRYHALTDFRDHLQNFIENEISKAENQTGE